jgi:hypothetical protein
VAIGVALEVGRLGSRTGVPIAMLLSALIGCFTAGLGWLTPAAIGPAEFGAALYRGGRMAVHWVGPLFFFLALSVSMLIASLAGRRLRSRVASLVRRTRQGSG